MNQYRYSAMVVVDGSGAFYTTGQQTSAITCRNIVMKMDELSDGTTTKVLNGLNEGRTSNKLGVWVYNRLSEDEVKEIDNEW